MKMPARTNAPMLDTLIICRVLFTVALASRLALIQPGPLVAT